jgi:hypothetical protein
MKQNASRDRQEIREHLWAPEVHEALGERLTFFFLRTAYSKLAVQEFKKILDDSGLPAFSYLLFGQFDFLARVWGSPEALAQLEQKLKDFSRRFLGDCIPIPVKSISYAWTAPGRPKADTVAAFCEKLREMKAAERCDYLQREEESLKDNRLIVATLDTRQAHPMKAFTVIRNFNIAAQSYNLMERVLTDEVKAFCDVERKRDATLYSTRGDIHFIVRWGANDFHDLVEAISNLTETLEREGFAALFETYFRATNVEAERENPVLLREAAKDRQAPPADDALRWEQAVPQFKDASDVRRTLFLQLTKTREFDLSADQVEADKALRDVLASYFQESIASFTAFLAQFYSQFETRLRNKVLAKYWPSDVESEQASTLQEWQKLLGRTQPIATGTDAGKLVPKLALGDLLKLTRQLRPDAFDPAADRRLDDLLRLRNQVTHGTAAVDFDMFIPFLAQASACGKLLKALEIQPKMPSK